MLIIGYSLGGPRPGLADQGAVGVIGQGDAPLQPRFEPVGQGHLLPAGEVDGDARDPGGAIHGARQTNAHQIG